MTLIANKSTIKTQPKASARVFVVDGNWYLHRCFFTLKTSRPYEDVLPYNFLRLVCKDATILRATHLLVAFDGPNVFRYKLFPGYKASRDKEVVVSETDHEEQGRDVYQYLPATRALLERAGIQWIQSSKHEADDVLASAARQYSVLPEVAQVIMGSQDKDGYQSLIAKVIAYSSSEEPARKITAEWASKKLGVKIDQMVMYQTLIGDRIDDIPTLLGPSKAKAACVKWGSFKNWHAKGSPDDIKWLRQNMIALRLNRKLVEMVTDIGLPDLKSLVVPKQDLGESMPPSWHSYQTLLYPKIKSLFGKR